MTPQHEVVLRKARKVIQDGKEIMICLAIERVIDKNPQLRKEGVYLQKYIMKQLGATSGLRYWQITHDIIHDSAERRQDRINWISWMLGEL